jgi:BlaI family penicillinase repressor
MLTSHTFLVDTAFPCVIDSHLKAMNTVVIGESTMAELNRNELEAMRVLWERGAVKPAEIQEAFSWTIENATLRSVLRVLVDKDLVVRSKKGKAYFYRSKKRRGTLLKEMTGRMAHVFAGGSPAGLIAHLIKTEKLSGEEVEELRRIADERAAGSDG